MHDTLPLLIDSDFPALHRDRLETVQANLGYRCNQSCSHCHVGASPLQTAKTFRIQRAKRLLNETDLPMTEIAFRSGFKSLRRFNTVFQELYGRPPSRMRRRPKTVAPEAHRFHSHEAMLNAG